MTRKKTRMSAFTTSIPKKLLEGLSIAIRKENEIKCLKIKEEAKLSLFADDLTVYIENSIDSTKKLLDLINEFGKHMGYRVNTQKSNTFLYTNNEISGTTIRKNSHLL